MHKIFLIIITLFLASLLACSPAQLGKIFSSSEANELFGDVIFSTGIPIDTVASIVSRTEKNIMFGIINQNVIVLDNKRNLLYPRKAEFRDTDVFTVYSVSIVKELLFINSFKKESTVEVNVEMRRYVITLSTNNYTLEMGSKCPPVCPD